MKLWKRFGAALLAMAVLASMLTGTVLAEEPGVGNEGISVQLDGKGLTFTDAVPEIISGRTFLPFRAVLEAMGAEVDFDAETSTVSAQKDGVKLSMVPGQTALTVAEGDQTRTVEMDVAPYIKASNSRTYIPVRYAAEALGYSVGWDQDNRTVILVDVDALFGDATFTLMDNFAAYSEKQAKADNYALSGKLGLDMNLDIPNSDGTVQTVPVSAKGSVDGILSDTAAQLSWALDLSGMADILEGLTGMGGLAPTLDGEVRMNLESGMIYLTLPAILTGGSANTWYSLDLNAYQDELFSVLDMAQLTQLQTQLQDAGIREALVTVFQTFPLDDSTFSYELLAMMANLYTATLSDQAFTQKGNTYVAQMTMKDIMDLMVNDIEDAGIEVPEDAMSLTITLTKRGNDIVSADVKMNFNLDEDGTKVVMTMDEHAAPDKVTVAMKMEVADSEVSVKLDMDLSCLPTDKTPETALPAGAQAAPLDQPPATSSAGNSPVEG